MPAKRPDHHTRLDEQQAWRKWYKSKRWQLLRQAVFMRDRFICQRSGVVCMGKSPAPNSPVANHKKPHKGDETLFFDIDNIETVSKEIHDGLIQREEKRKIVIGNGIDGRPIDPAHPWNQSRGQSNPR